VRAKRFAYRPEDGTEKAPPQIGDDGIYSGFGLILIDHGNGSCAAGYHQIVLVNEL
jgi:hypothetical protein